MLQRTLKIVIKAAVPYCTQTRPTWALTHLHLPQERTTFPPACRGLNRAFSKRLLSNDSMVTKAESKQNDKVGVPKSRERQDAQQIDKENSPVAALSASLILIAPLSRTTVDGYDYRVLLLKRHAKSSTFVSAHVFPGGNIDAVDTSPIWSSRYFPDKELHPSALISKTESPATISAVTESAVSDRATNEETRMQTNKLIAVREAFEECGILLVESQSKDANPSKNEETYAWESLKEEEKMIWRDKVHENGMAFIELFDYLSERSTESGSGSGRLRPALDRLQYRANWITPRGLPRRYDTHFFISILPQPVESASVEPIHSTPIVSSDGQETISADWLTPREAISRTLVHTRSLMNPETGTDNARDHKVPTTAESIILFPPQFYLLAELAACKTWKSLVIEDQGDLMVRARRIEAFEPEIKGVFDERGEMRPATVLPGDPEHSKTDELLARSGRVWTAEEKESMRNRTYVLVPGRDNSKKKGPPGLTVIGVHRRGLSEVLGSEWPDMMEGDVIVSKSKL